MSLFKDARFVRFFASYTIGNIGDWFDVFALQIISVNQWHATPELMGVLLLFFFLPSIVLSPLAGVWADRVSKRNLMLYTDLAAAVLTIGLYFSSNMSMALAILLLRSCVTTINAPAQQAYIKHIVTEDQLLKASSLTTVVFQFCKVFGPMLGAVVLVIASAQSCLLINAISFMISAIILVSLAKDKPDHDDEVKLHWRQDMLTGIKFIWQHNFLRLMVGFVTIWFFCSLIRQAQMAIYLKHLLPNNQHALGWFMGFDGLGAVISSTLMSRKKEIDHYSRYFFLGFLLIGLGILGMSVYQSQWPVILLYVIGVLIGTGSGVLLVCYGYIVKKETPNEQMGRVSATSSALGSAALAIGTLLSGFLVALFGIREVYFSLFVVMLVLAILSLVLMKRYQKQ